MPDRNGKVNRNERYSQQIKALADVKDGKWDEAHRLVQSMADRDSCLIHGYLHRVEGDFGNARYWYGRANRTMPENSLEEEWNRLRDLIGFD